MSISKSAGAKYPTHCYADEFPKRNMHVPELLDTVGALHAAEDRKGLDLNHDHDDEVIASSAVAPLVPKGDNMPFLGCFHWLEEPKLSLAGMERQC